MAKVAINKGSEVKFTCWAGHINIFFSESEGKWFAFIGWPRLGSWFWGSLLCTGLQCNAHLAQWYPPLAYICAKLSLHLQTFFGAVRGVHAGSNTYLFPPYIFSFFRSYQPKTGSKHWQHLERKGNLSSRESNGWWSVLFVGNKGFPLLGYNPPL